MQRSLVPFNVYLLNLTPEKLKNLGQVSSLARFEGITHNYQPDGLFSTKIFGRTGDPLRSRRYAYIDVRMEIFHPVIYNILIQLKRLYGGIMAGKEFAIWNSEKKDFERSNPVDGDTGYYFFVKYWDQIVFQETGSDKRSEAIKVLDKYKKHAMTSKVLVLPAGLRDVEIGPDGRAREDEVNALYRQLIAGANTLSDIAIRANPEINDRARFRLQSTFVNIYEMFEKIIYGKKKLIQGKFTSRRIMNGSRNVITAMPVDIPDLGEEGNVGFNDISVGLFQVMKGLLPVTLYNLKHGWLKEVFPVQGQPAMLVDPKTLKRKMIQVKSEYYDRYQTNEGLEKVINAFRDESVRDKPMIIEGHYIGLIYKGDGDVKTFKIFNDIDDLPPHLSRDDVHPMTFCELMYLSGYRVWNTYPATATRYPITGVGSIYPAMVYVRTTTVAERRTELGDNWELLDSAHTATQFPIAGKPYMNAMSPHPTRLAKLGGDFDGDMMNLNIGYTEETRAEVKKFLKSRRAYVGTDGRFISSTSTFTANLLMHNLTGAAVKPR